MRLLICAGEAPLGASNGLRLPAAALWEQLGSRHDLRMLAFRMPDQAEPAPEGVRLVRYPTARRLPEAARALGGGRPASVDLLAARLVEPLRQELAAFNPHAVLVLSPRLAALGRLLEDVPSMLVALDAWHRYLDHEISGASGTHSLALRVHRRHVLRFQREEFPRFGRVVVVSHEDADALREAVPGLPVAVVPNGVSEEFLQAPRPMVERLQGRVVFHGTMDYPPNVLAATYAARTVLPRLRRAQPDASLALVGRQPVAPVAALGRLPGVTVTGAVRDVRPWLYSADAYLCAMRSGTGIKNKVLEAMACGLPVVTTPLGLQGIEHARDGIHVLVAEDSDGLAAQLDRVLRDPALAAAIGRRGRRLVSDRYRWEHTAAAYESLLEAEVDRCADSA